MMHHVFCMELLNIDFYFLNNIFHLNGFDIIKFKSLGGWYRYYGGTKQLAIVYITIGIIGSLIIAKLEDFIKYHINYQSTKINFRKKEKNETI